jgi:hypothetical protein
VNALSCENHARFTQYSSENILFVGAFHPRRLLYFPIFHQNSGNTRRPCYLKIFLSVFFVFQPSPEDFHITYSRGLGARW